MKPLKLFYKGYLGNWSLECPPATNRKPQSEAQRTSRFLCDGGVPQGSTLGPLPFYITTVICAFTPTAQSDGTENTIDRRSVKDVSACSSSAAAVHAVRLYSSGHKDRALHARDR